MTSKIVTVIGANGITGTNVSAIFASFGNAKVYMVSRDLEKSKTSGLKAGTASNYQVQRAKNGMMLNIGGSATTNYVFIV